MITVPIAMGAAPATPDRPGRPTPDQAGVPPESPPTSRPVATSRPTANGQVPLSDQDLLDETAHDLDVRTPAQRPDEAVLKLFGLRPQVEEYGVTVAAAYTADLSRLSQGMNTRTDAFRQLFDARLNVDTRPLLKVDGGLFSVDFQNQNGRNGSAVLTGDVQGFDNADADGRTQVSELWYQQSLLDERVRLKVGKVDANSEFAFATAAAAFLGSSFGHAPTLVGMPTYPDPAMSANAFVYPAPWLSAGAGIYDGSKVAGVNTGDYGPKHFFTGTNGHFLIGEATGRWAFADKTLPGRLSLGGWGSTSTFVRFDGQTQGGSGGFYVVGEQTLWHKKYYQPTDGQGVAAFVQYGNADRNVSGVVDYVGGGVVDTGPLADLIADPARQNDTVGVGVEYGRLSQAAGAGFTKDFELSAELFYGLQVTPYLLLKPDVQYIIHPAYAPAKDAVAFTIRATLAF